MIDLSKKDHDLLDRYLNIVLDRYKTGQTHLIKARTDLAHAFTMISKDDESVWAYMRAKIRK